MRFTHTSIGHVATLLVACLSPLADGCAGSSTAAAPANTTQPSIGLALSSAQVVAYTNAAASSDRLVLTRNNLTTSITASLIGLPTGVSAEITQPGTTSTGTVAFTEATAALGSYPLTIRVTDGTYTAAASLTLTVGVGLSVTPTTTGSFMEAMSTSFQLASWTNSTFTTYPGIPAQLNTLNPHHIRMQAIDVDVPETAPGTWNFAPLDSQVQPLLTAADHSPEFQIGAAPPYLAATTTNFVTPAYISGFADYSSKLVQYYNTGGFTPTGGTLLQSPSSTPIHYWGILNEPSYNNISAADYTSLYNATVPAMQAVDPTVKIVALELGGDYGSIHTFLPVFAQSVTAQVDSVALHFYSSCNQRDTDQAVMGTIPGFAQSIQYTYQQMKTNPKLAAVPVWVLENNVNADFPNASGNSTCTPSEVFVEDDRGTGPFFAAWRPYVFSQFGKVGVQSLYHWSFVSDTQFGELNASNYPAQLQLSYWVDYWLGQYYPPAVAAQMLTVNNTDQSELEVLATKQSSGKVVVMVSNHAVANATDNNGAGIVRSVLIDVSALGSFTSAKQLTMDATTDPINGPTEVAVPFASQVPVTMNGYGVTFLILQ